MGAFKQNMSGHAEQDSEFLRAESIPMPMLMLMRKMLYPYLQPVQSTIIRTDCLLEPSRRKVGEK